MWEQVSPPRTGQEDGLGWCLRQTQAVFAAPVKYATAREAWDNQVGRHAGELPPRGVSVPIWLDHWGSYGRPAKWGNFGHVATSLPDGRVLTSPLLTKHLNRWDQVKGEMVGSAIYPSIQALQKDIGGSPTYLGWSEYMNGKQVVSWEEPMLEEQEEEDEMAQAHSMQATINGTIVQAVYDREGFWTQWIGGDDTYNANVRKMLGCTTLHCRVSESHFNAIKRSVLSKSSTKVEILSPSIPVGGESA